MSEPTGYRVTQSFHDGRGRVYRNGEILPVALVDGWKTKLARLEARQIEPTFSDAEPSPPPTPRAGPAFIQPVVVEEAPAPAAVDERQVAGQFECPVCGEQKQSAKAVRLHMSHKHKGQEVSP